jgi:beta-phosphoglucomutase-like phosphatase (HAD superfamily)
LEERIIGEGIKRIQMKATLMTGVDHALSLFRTKRLKMGLASSCAYRIIWTVLEKFNLREQFDFIYSAEEE